MAPPPSTISDRGTCSVSIASRLVQYGVPASPSMGGISGSVPVLITMPRPARNTRGGAPSGPVTVISPGAVIRPLPRANLPPLAVNRSTATVSSQESVASFLIRWATGAQSGATSAEPGHARDPAALGQQVRGPDHHLGRNAPPVRALPADQPVLDADHGKPGLGQPPGEVLAAGPHADHDDVRLLGLHLPTLPGSGPARVPASRPDHSSPGAMADTQWPRGVQARL